MQELLMATRPQSQDRRELFLPTHLNDALEKRAARFYTSVTSQILLALEQYLQTPFDLKQRLLIGEKGNRRPVNIPDSIWNELKSRKAETGLDLNEQVQIAVALYLQSEASGANKGDLELTPPEGKQLRKPKPLSPEETERFQRLIDERVNERVDQVVEEKLSQMERSRAAGFEVRPAIPAALQPPSIRVPKTKMVSCGAGTDLDNIVEFLAEAGEVELIGRLAAKVTPNSYIAVAHGWSMAQANSRMSILDGDEILLTPIDEYPNGIKIGSIVLVEIKFKDGTMVETLKAYEKKRLRANNPDYPGFELGPTMERARIVAVCRGVLEKVFD
jgi:hypothetical protein